MTDKELWDVVVVGGGPAGMMAAGAAADRGARVILFEKNGTPGKKLLITGGGRCNVMNAEPDVRKLLSKFKDDGKFLFSAFSRWGVKETLDFFHARGMDTKVENELRVFPVSDSAQSVLDVLVKNMRRHGVTVRTNAPIIGIVRGGEGIAGVRLKSGEVVKGRAFVLATGGTSRPETGSTGEGFAWLRDIGHTVAMPEPSLVPIAIKESWVKRLAGVSMSDMKITVFQNGAKQNVSKGKVLFTHVGISGPTILNMSKDVGELLKYGAVTLSLDLLPEQDYGVLNSTLQELFREHDKKKFRNALANLVPSAIAPIVVELSHIDPEIQCNSITREARLALVTLLKGIPLTVAGLLGADKAIVTSGGVAPSEVDFKPMRSRLFANLYLVGDILDIDRPSGGYSLQLCWTTGFVAGISASGR
jgi:hypothetical protein